MSAHIEEVGKPWSHGRDFTQPWQFRGSAVSITPTRMIRGAHGLFKPGVSIP
jgi:hypothetical protein